MVTCFMEGGGNTETHHQTTRSETIMHTHEPTRKTPVIQPVTDTLQAASQQPPQNMLCAHSQHVIFSHPLSCLGAVVHVHNKQGDTGAKRLAARPKGQPLITATMYVERIGLSVRAGAQLQCHMYINTHNSLSPPGEVSSCIEKNRLCHVTLGERVLLLEQVGDSHGIDCPALACRALCGYHNRQWRSVDAEHGGSACA